MKPNSNEKVMGQIASIACNSTIASNKQRLEHNNLAIIRRIKLKGAHELSKSPQFVKT